MKYIKLVAYAFATFAAINLFLINSSLLFAPTLNPKVIDAPMPAGIKADEYDKFMQELNNLSDDDLAMFAQLGQELEKQLKQEGVDASNTDEVLKWIDNQMGQMDFGTQEKKTEPKPIMPEQKKAPEIKTEIVQVAKPTDALAMLQALINHISILHQKAIGKEAFKKQISRFKPELEELLYYLNILQEADLLKHLTSKDFQELYTNLDSLYFSLAQNEPKIKIKEPLKEELENPYDILGIPTNATQEEISETFNALKEQLSSQVITQRLKAQNVPQKELNRRIKQANISFKFIQHAYDTLSDRKQKAITDRTLREQISEERTLARISEDAFNLILRNFSEKLPRILGEIKKLLEKYKPEELAKLKMQEELQKNILAESKKPQIMTPTQIPPRTKEDKFEEFYRQLAQEEFQRQFAYPFRYPGMSSGPGFPAKEGSRQTKPEEHGKGAKETSKEGGGKPKSESKKGEKEDKKKEESGKELKELKDLKEKGLPKEEIDLVGLTFEIANLLSRIKDEVEIEKPILVTTRGQTIPEIKKEKVKLSDLKKSLSDYLKAEQEPATQEQNKEEVKQTRKAPELTEINNEELEPEKPQAINQIVKDVKLITKSLQLPKLWQDLKKLSSQKKLESSTVSQIWKDRILKQDKAIKELKELYDILANQKGEFSNKTLKAVGLDKVIEDKDAKDIKALEEIDKANPESLAIQKKYLHDILSMLRDLSNKFLAKEKETAKKKETERQKEIIEKTKEEQKAQEQQAQQKEKTQKS